MSKIYQFSDVLQRISVLMQSDSFSKDYGTGDKYTPMEAHTIGYIFDHPGCTNKDIAYTWGKSTSAVSQIMKRLKTYDLISIKKDEKDSKKQLLYLTKKGEELHMKHRQYDENIYTPTMNCLLEKYDDTQIDTTIQILESYLDLYCQSKKK